MPKCFLLRELSAENPWEKTQIDDPAEDPVVGFCEFAKVYVSPVICQTQCFATPKKAKKTKKIKRLPKTKSTSILKWKK